MRPIGLLFYRGVLFSEGETILTRDLGDVSLLERCLERWKKMSDPIITKVSEGEMALTRDLEDVSLLERCLERCPHLGGVLYGRSTVNQ